MQQECILTVTHKTKYPDHLLTKLDVVFLTRHLHTKELEYIFKTKYIVQCSTPAALGRLEPRTSSRLVE